MFVSIDMDKLQFLHVHHDHETLSGLAWLEAPNKSVMIENTDREHFLSKMSGLDLRMLYRNTTALDITGTTDIVVREMLATIVNDHIKPTLALAHEVQAQIKVVEDDLYSGVPWKYSIGSTRPARQEELFPLHCKPLTPDAAQQAAQRAPQRRKLPTPIQPRPQREDSPSAPRVPKQRASSVRPTIWAVADRMWEEAGKPEDKTVVLELRKKMMEVLEREHLVKRTSSSNELGNWMKTRLAN